MTAKIHHLQRFLIRNTPFLISDHCVLFVTGENDVSRGVSRRKNSGFTAARADRSLLKEIYDDYFFRTALASAKNATSSPLRRGIVVRDHGDTSKCLADQ